MAVIYIVEDDLNIREIERYVLKNSGFDVEEFGTGSELFHRLETQKPVLILLDIMLPDMDGFSILAKIRKNKSLADIPIIMVTAKSAEIDKVKGLDSGADDYMTKPFGIMELTSRVKAVLRRTEKVKEDTIIVCGEVTLDNDKRSVMSAGEYCELTYKEFELLKYLMMNQGIVLSRDKLMNHVWGFDYEGGTRTVDMHIKTLRQKLGNGSGCIKTVRNVGYMVE